MALRIGELARRGGVTPAALRYYEAAGLLVPTSRTESGYRIYEAAAPGRIGAVRSESLTGWAGLWMRVDSPVSARHLAFDNMQDRPIKGTTDWRRYAVVLDVDESTAAIAFGVLAVGEGKLWATSASTSRHMTNP